MIKIKVYKRNFVIIWEAINRTIAVCQCGEYIQVIIVTSKVSTNLISFAIEFKITKRPG